MTGTITLADGLLDDIRNADDGTGPFSCSYIQVVVDRTNGHAWGIFHYSVGRNEWTRYHDPNILTVGSYAGRLGADELKAMIRTRLNEEEQP